MRPDPAPYQLFHSLPALFVCLVAPAALAPSAWAATPSSLQAEVLIDGDADNNVDATPLDRRRDDVVLEIDGEAATRVAVAFGSGVRMRALPSTPRRRLVGYLFVTAVPDPERSAQTPTTTQYTVRLLPTTSGQAATLEVAGSQTVTATWDGPSRVLEFGALPDNAVRLEFHTAGPIGVGLLSLAAVCRDDDRLAGYRATAETHGGRLTTSAPAHRRDRCGSLPPLE